MDKLQAAGPLPGSRSLEPAAGAVRLLTIIASAPGVAEQALKATLAALHSVQLVGTAAGCLSALQMVREKRADLVVIDSNLPFEDVQVFLQQLKAEGLTTYSLVLSTTRGQVRRALAAGADVALRRDASVRQLGAAVAGLQRAHTGAGLEPDGGNPLG